MFFLFFLPFFFFWSKSKKEKEKGKFKGQTSECPKCPIGSYSICDKESPLPSDERFQHFSEIKGCRKLRNQMPRILKVVVINVFVFLTLLFPFKDISFASQIGMG